MNREQLKALGLTDEQIEAVMKEHGKTINTTKEQLESATNERDELKTQLTERDKQLETLKTDAGTNETLKAQIATLQADNEAAKQKFEADLKDLQLTNAIKTAFIGKVHDEGLAAGLIDKSKLVLDGDKIVGLDDQITALQKDKAFLFKPEDNQQKPPGFHVGGGGNPTPPAGEVSLTDAIAAHFQK